MTTTTTTTPNLRAALGTAYGLRKTLATILAEQGKTEDQIDALCYTVTEPVRRYAETIDELRRVYNRIATSAEQMVAHIDSNYAVHSNDALGSDRDRLVTLHTSAEIYRNQVATVRHMLDSLDIAIDPFDYTGSN